MRSPAMSTYPVSDMFVRFAIITAVAVVWCSLSIPVEGVDNNVEENPDGVQNCLKAIQEVQKDPNNEETVRRFIDLCKEFIDEMELSENQTAILEQAGYKRSKKSKGKVEESKIGDKSDENATSDKKDHIKDPRTSDKQDKSSGNNEEASPGKKSEADVYDSVTQDKDHDKTEKESVKHPKLKQNKEKSPPKIHKEAPKPQGKDEAPKPQGKDEAPKPQGKDEAPKPQGKDEAPKPQGKGEAEETLLQGEKLSEPETVISTESEHEGSKSQEEQTPQSEQMHSQNLQEDLPLFDFSTLNFPEMTPDEIAKTIEELKEVRRMLKMQHAPQPEVQIHANFPDPTLQGIHAPHFGQGIPQFQQQEWNAQFQNPAFTEGIPHMHMNFEQANGIPKPTFQQGIPPFPQQNIPPFPQQAEFAGHFQHQHFGQGIPQMPPAPERVAPFPDQKFGQGIPQMPPAPERIALFPDQKFGQGIPQPNRGAEVSETSQGPDQQPTNQPPNVPPTNEELSTKRQIDEL